MSLLIKMYDHTAVLRLRIALENPFLVPAEATIYERAVGEHMAECGKPNSNAFEPIQNRNQDVAEASITELLARMKPVLQAEPGLRTYEIADRLGVDRVWLNNRMGQIRRRPEIASRGINSKRLYFFREKAAK